jgi:hypothetical protein
MKTILLKEGDVLYNAGDASDGVYFIESGEIEVRRAGTSEGAPVPVAVLGRGEIVGEIGVINSAPRSTTTVAVENSRLAVLDRETFLKAFGGEDGLGVSLLKLICKRMCDIKSVAHGNIPPGVVGGPDLQQVRILGGSPQTKGFIGPSGHVIDQFPFTIGLALGLSTEKTPGRLGLPFREGGVIADRHLRIDVDDEGHVVVFDLQDKLGSMVNGDAISVFKRGSMVGATKLHIGDNEIVAGGAISKVRFILRIKRAMLVVNAA